MKLSSGEVGELGERLAEQFLAGKGFRILERNFRTKLGEIDLVVEKGDCTHFVEVKAISRENTQDMFSRENSAPEHRVDERKLLRLKRAVERYVAQNKVEGDFQIDVVAVRIDSKKKTAYCGHFEAVL